MIITDLSRIPVHKGTNPRLGWTKYSDLCEIVHPSLVLISLRALTICTGISVENGTGIFFGTENRKGIEFYHLQNTGKVFAFSGHEVWH